MPEAVIVSALHTPIDTAMKGTVLDTDAYQLADHVVGNAVAMCAGGGMGSATVFEVPAA